MIHLLIDGYNLLHAIDPVVTRTLEQKRASLLERLSLYQTTRHLDITVIFDGSREASLYPQRDKWGEIEILYTIDSQTADEWIARECERSPGKYLVISNDLEVVRAAERESCLTLSCQELDRRMRQASPPVIRDPYTHEAIDKDDGELSPLYPKISTRKKGVAKKLPKRDRRKAQRLKHL